MSLFNFERQQKALKHHDCHSTGCTIEPGQMYWVVGNFPGTYVSATGPGEYDTESYDFGWMKLCQKHYDEMVHGGYSMSDEELAAIIEEESALARDEITYEQRAQSIEANRAADNVLRFDGPVHASVASHAMSFSGEMLG